MSLLNDALRKQKKKPALTGAPQFFGKQARRRPLAMRRLAGTAVILIAAAILAYTGSRYLGDSGSPQTTSARRNAQVVARPIPVSPPLPETAETLLVADVIPRDNAPSAPGSPSRKAVPAEDSQPVAAGATHSGIAKPKPLLTVTPQPVGLSSTGKSAVESTRKPPAAIKSIVARPKPHRAATRPVIPKKEIESKDTGPAPASPTANPYYRKGLRYHRQNDFSGAIRMYRQVLAQNPDHVDATLNLAAAYIKIARFNEAYPLLKRLQTHDPQNPKVLLNLAAAEIGLDRPRAALSALDGLEPGSDQSQFEVYFTKAVALSRLNRTNEALGWYQKAADLNPKHPQLLFNMAVAHDRMENFGEAVHYYSAFLKHHQASTGETGGTDTRRVENSGVEIRRVEIRINRLKTYLAAKTAAPGSSSK